MRVLRIFAGGLISCYFLASSTIVASSASGANSAPVKPPFVFPTDLGGKEVQDLVNRVDSRQSVMMLKYGYFGRRMDYSFPPLEGLKLIDRAIATEPVATRRWFILNNIRSYASFRVLGANPDEGFENYKAVFSHSDEAIKSDLGYFVLQSVSDLLFDVRGRFRDIGLRQDKKTVDTMLLAWKAYINVISHDQKRNFIIGSLPWGQAIKASSSTSVFLPVINDSFRDAKVHNNYDVAYAVAFVNRKEKPKFSISILEQSKSLIPPKDKRAIFQHYSLLVDLYKESNLPKAIGNQIQLISLILKGYDRLLQLYLDSGKDEEAKNLVSQIMYKTTDDSQIANVADIVFDWMGNSVAQYQSWDPLLEKLLTNYLYSNRKRLAPVELHMKVMLGVILIKAQRLNEARTLLSSLRVAEPSRSSRSFQDYSNLIMIQNFLTSEKKTR